MPIQFMTSPRYLLTSESVTEGHPDKVCDQISDAVLDAALSVDPMSRVACETVAGKNLVMVTGEITTQADLDFDAITRKTLLEIGYNNLKYGIDGHSCGIIRNASQQSPDINAGVSTALEARNNGAAADARRATGAERSVAKQLCSRHSSAAGRCSASGAASSTGTHGSQRPGTTR